MALLTDNLVTYYKLDGNSTDSVGGNNGTDTAIAYSTGNGKLIQGAGFNGSTSNITSAGASLAFAGPLTVSCWINASVLPTTGNIMSIVSRFTNTVGQFGYDLRLRNTGGVQQIQFSSDTVLANANVTIAAGAWYHLVAVSGTSVTLYMNGAVIATDPGMITGIATNNLYIGAIDYNAGVQRFFNGKVDEIGIWNRALSPSEITNIYNNGVGIQYPFGGMSGSQLLNLM